MTLEWAVLPLLLLPVLLLLLCELLFRMKLALLMGSLCRQHHSKGYQLQLDPHGPR